MKLCAFDIDGTLIDDTMENGEFVVYPEIISALNAFLDQGIRSFWPRVVLCPG
jgi:hydroxymethylpyrimidine pyrophosphatase-like HAD family hydrolase